MMQMTRLLRLAFESGFPAAALMTTVSVVAAQQPIVTLQEASYPPVQYIPREDTQMGSLQATQHKTHCPYKGDASYFSVKAGDKSAENAVWSYVEPYPAVSEIAGHLAFYPDRMDSIEVAK